jgi:hypothetical protein
LETSPASLKALADLIKSLRDRLSDTQINLRPIAARAIGELLCLLDAPSQAKLGKLAFPALLNSAMNDIKKPVRDASLNSIKAGVRISSMDGGVFNELAAEVLIGCLEVNDTAIKVSELVHYKGNV